MIQKLLAKSCNIENYIQPDCLRAFLSLQGHFVKNLGEIGDKDTENQVLLLEHDVPHGPFSETVLSFLPKMPWTITDEVSKVTDVGREGGGVDEEIRWKLFLFFFFVYTRL